MNRRAAFHEQVTAAASRGGVTLVTGLPRVGRTTLLDEWLRDHPEARECHEISEISGGGRTFILDHVDESAADEIAKVARSLEAANNPAQLFVLPIDLKTGARIQQKLDYPDRWGIAHPPSPTNPLQVPGPVGR